MLMKLGGKELLAAAGTLGVCAREWNVVMEKEEIQSDSG